MLPCIGLLHRRQLVFVLCKVLPAFLPTDKMAPLITAFAFST